MNWIALLPYYDDSCSALPPIQRSSSSGNGSCKLLTACRKRGRAEPWWRYSNMEPWRTAISERAMIWTDESKWIQHLSSFMTRGFAHIFSNRWEKTVKTRSLSHHAPVSCLAVSLTFSARSQPVAEVNTWREATANTICIGRLMGMVTSAHQHHLKILQTSSNRC